MAATSTMVQMNTRIDRTLKQEGDRVFKEEGFTPSEAIRAFWDYAARTGGKSEALQTVLKEAPAEEDGITPQLEALRQGRAEICEAMSKLGLGENPSSVRRRLGLWRASRFLSGGAFGREGREVDLMDLTDVRIMVDTNVWVDNFYGARRGTTKSSKSLDLAAGRGA